MVVQRQAYMTLRSLTMAAYVILNEGYFSLLIAACASEKPNCCVSARSCPAIQTTCA